MTGLAESTHKLYVCGVRRFIGICSAAGRIPVPADKGTLCHLAVTLAMEGLRHGTIKSYMVGIRHLNFQQDCTDCTMSCRG